MAAAPIESHLAQAALALFPEGVRKHRKLRELCARMDALKNAESLRARIDALERLSQWVMRTDINVPVPDPPESPVPAPMHRLGVWITVLERAPEIAAVVRSSIEALIADTDGLGLLAETGLPNDRGILSETADRVFRRVLPAPRDDHQLSRLLLRLFPTESEAAWLEGISPEMFGRLAEALGVGNDWSPFAALENSAADAFALLAARVQSLGLAEEMRARGSGGSLRESPFFQLSRAADLVLARLPAEGPRREAERVFRETAGRCRTEIKVVVAHLEQRGISVDVVYGLEVMELALMRMERLLEVLSAPTPADRVFAARSLLRLLVVARLGDRSLRQLFRSNMKLLSRKIIERAGQTGEHYIAHTRKEYWALLLAGMGGGVLTALTAAGKFGVSGAGFPPFVEGFLSALNYSLSFILIQSLGFTLATKQPSMTAAHLAGVIRQSEGPSRIEHLVSYTARICRSQIAAAVGNVSTVALGAFALDMFWRLTKGHPLLTPEKATYVMGSFHILHSGTIFYAALTGVILWSSSLMAGWMENFVVYHRVPEGIAEHRLGRIVGQRAMAKVARFVSRNVSGYGGSVALGFMLGMTPVLGRFFGLPIDVRHVTLSAGSLTLGAAALGPQSVLEGPFLWALGGIGVIFVLNLSTSFLLALTVALRARDVSAHDKWRLLGSFMARALRSPAQFFLPPGRTETADSEPEHGTPNRPPAAAHGGHPAADERIP